MEDTSNPTENYQNRRLIVKSKNDERRLEILKPINESEYYQVGQRKTWSSIAQLIRENGRGLELHFENPELKKELYSLIERQDQLRTERKEKYTKQLA